MKPIILCCGTNGRAIVYGRVESEPAPGESVTLYGARMVLYWSEACGGLFGLAATGPRKGCRVTEPVASVTETKWQECLSVSEKSAKVFDGWDK
jgi:hypothetical protein